MADRFRFGQFLLDVGERQLRRDGQPVELNSRYLDALALMLREPGKLVAKDRFIAEVWRGIPVTDEALTQCIKTLRKQLGDDAASPQFIETVPKHGYRFIADVEAGGLAAPAPRSAVRARSSQSPGNAFDRTARRMGRRRRMAGTMTVDTPIEAQVSGSSFYAAMRLMPKPERAAMFAIYSFCRMVDDIADDGTRPRPQRAAELNEWRADLAALYDSRPAGRAAFLKDAMQAFGLRQADFLAVIDGMDMDVAGDIRAPDLATLDLYCDRVAVAVGRLSVRIFGMDEKPGLELARELGRAEVEWRSLSCDIEVLEQQRDEQRTR